MRNLGVFLVASLLGIGFALSAPASELRTRFLSFKHGALALRVGVQRPEGAVAGDVLYLHGFGDRLDNHGPLFEAWNRAGLRVISFDLPSHGETHGLASNIDFYSFRDLAELALDVERATREDVRRPLILAGWSTGALIATRMLQKQIHMSFERNVAGAILIAPAVSVPPLVGEKGIVTERTLTSNPNPPHAGPISPRSPLLHPIFAGHLVANAELARLEALPAGVPILVVTAGDELDRYVNSSKLRDWTLDQREKNGALTLGLRCDEARHELDNEPSPVGAQVRLSASRFARAAAAGFVLEAEALPTGSCRPF